VGGEIREWKVIPTDGVAIESKHCQYGLAGTYQEHMVDGLEHIGDVSDRYYP